MSAGDKLNHGIPSGVHRYAGDPDRLRLRLLFSDHARLATRPRFRSSRQAHQISSKPPTNINGTGEGNQATYTGSCRADQEQSGSEAGFLSSYLIRKSGSRWTICCEEARRNCPLQGSGLTLSVTSDSGCEGCANSASKLVVDGGTLIEDRPQAGTVGADVYDGDHDYNEKLEEFTRSERAFNWKDTVSGVGVTSAYGQNEWERTTARKLLLSEMRNHYTARHGTNTGGAHCEQSAARLSRSLQGFAACCSSDGSNEIVARERDDCCLLTDWYQRQLLNLSSKDPKAKIEKLTDGCECERRRRVAGGRPLKLPIDPGNSTSGEQIGDNLRATGVSAPDSCAKIEADSGSDSQSSPKLAANISDATNSAAAVGSPRVMEIKAQQSARSDGIRQHQCKGSRCAHVEILYITMEKLETRNDSVAGGGESFAQAPAAAATATTTSADETAAKTAVEPTVSRPAGQATRDAASEVPSSSSPEAEPKVQEPEHHESSTERVNSQPHLSSDDRNRYQDGERRDEARWRREEPADKALDDDEHARRSRFHCDHQLDGYGAKSYEDDDDCCCCCCCCESSDNKDTGDDADGLEEKEEQLNLGADRRRGRSLSDQQGMMLGAHLRGKLNNGSRLGFRVLLCVIVVDKLNRLIQLKPDLSELISVDVRHQLAQFCGSNNLVTSLGAERESPISAAPGAGRKAADSLPSGQSPVLLVYQLQLLEGHRGGSAACKGSEANRQLNLLYRHLFWKPAEHADRSRCQAQAAGDQLPRASRGFFSPINGSTLIKLQLDIQVASEFPADCSNLYAKYKILARVKGNRWRLRRAQGPSAVNKPLATGYGRIGVKEETSSCQSVKLAQMSHFVPATAAASTVSEPPNESNRQRIQTVSSAVAGAASDDETKKPRAMSTLQSTLDAAPRRRLDVTAGPDTCLLEGSTITSRPDSRGRFHFACVEELAFELSVAPCCAATNNNDDRVNNNASLATQSRPLSSRSLSAFEGQSAARQRSSESSAEHNELLAVADASTTDRKASAGADMNFHHQPDDTSPRVGSEREARCDIGGTNQAIIVDGAHSNGRDTNENEPRTARQIPDNNSIMGSSEVANDGAGNLGTIADIRSAWPTFTRTGSRAHQRDGELEIVLLFEFYSSDFYRDKPQGWSHLSVPVNLSAMTPGGGDVSTGTMQRGRGCGARQVLYALPVIRPVLCSLVDRLRYYLVGQLPTSLPSLESFARSNHRYMMITRQSGKLELSFEVVRQYSDPNFDTVLRDLLEIGKGRSRKNHGVESSQNNSPNSSNIRGTDRENSDHGDNNGVGLDTRGVVEAYRRAKDRLERLTLSKSMTD